MWMLVDVGIDLQNKWKNTDLSKHWNNKKTKVNQSKVPHYKKLVHTFILTNKITTTSWINS